MSRRIKEKPQSADGLLTRIAGFFSARPGRSFDRALDRWLVWIGWVPEMMDGRGKILHISDTPTSMYGYLARLLRRVNPSVVVHTGDLADDIKLELYPGEAERYRAAAGRLFDILAAPRRKVIIALGNHDKKELLPVIPSQYIICDNVIDVTIYDQEFRVSHYFEQILDKPAMYNLFGHSPEQPSFSDGEERHFFNGMEMMRLMGQGTAAGFDYPRGTDEARLTRRSHRAR
jgi:3',5'-cyclic AMP phosphodiesterase CpdA